MLAKFVMVQGTIVRKSIAAKLFATSALLLGCSDEYSKIEKDYQVGPNGEPPKALKMVYAKEFVAEQKNYVRALGEIHAFLIENHFFPVVYNACFGDVLDIGITAHIEKHKRAFPCVAVQSTKGAELTDTYLRVSINDVKFNQLDHNNRVIYTVEIFGKQGLEGIFAANVEPSLFKLYSGSPARQSVLPHNLQLNQDKQQVVALCGICFSPVSAASYAT